MHRSLSPRGDTQPDVGTDQSECTLSVTRSTGVQGRPAGPLEGATMTGVGLGGMWGAWAVAVYQLVQMYFNILITGIAFLVLMGRPSVLLLPKIKLGEEVGKYVLGTMSSIFI